MIPLYEDLIEILEGELTHCARMIELLKTEREVIVGMDHKALEELLKDKQAVTDRIRQCDDRRESILRALGFDNKTISEVSETAEEEYKGRLKDIAARFKPVIRNISELNKINSMLIEKSLYYLKTSYNFLNTFDIRPKQRVSLEA